MTVALVANIIFTLAKSRRALIEALLREGHRVLIIAPDGPDRSDLDGLSVSYLPLLNLGRSSLNPFKEIFLIHELRSVFRRENVEVALLFNIKPVIFGNLATVGAKVSSIATITGAGNVFLKPTWLQLSTRLLYTISLKYSRLTFFQNEDDLNQFIDKRMVRASRTALVGGAGVDLKHFAFVPLSNQKHFLFVGRLLRDKGVFEFVAAARLARVIDPETRFTVVGDLDSHNVEAVDRETLSRWREEGIVDFVGAQTDIRPFLIAAGCVVLPSFREGCPRVLLEGGATGRPLITTDVPGCRSVVTNGHNGFLVPARDASALAQAMLEMSKMPPEELQAMGHRSRKEVEDRYDQHLVNAVYLKAIHQYG